MMVLDFAILIAVVVALSQIVKPFVPNNFMPLVSLALGIILGIFFVEAPVKEAIMQGIIIGLSASGLFDQTKIVTKKG